MAKLQWDQTGQRYYETGVDRGVLYIPTNGVYDKGYAWNGLTTVTESPSGAESNPQYADNIKYLNLVSAEEFGGTIEAFTYPDEFAQCDGTAVYHGGIAISQQKRKSFGMAYRTRLGNDVDGSDFGYKIHLIYGAQAAPSERAYATINDSPEAITFSWEITTNPVPVTGGSPTSVLTINSTKVPANKLEELENVLYGSSGVDPRLPLPDEIINMFAGTLTEVTPQAPAYTPATKTLVVPTTTGVNYLIDGKKVTGSIVLTKDTVVTATPAQGYKFPVVSDDDWFFDVA